MATPISLSFDRLEGKGKSIAVLLTDNGDIINLPHSLLPHEAKPGDVLTLTFEVDTAATTDLATKTRRIQDELSKQDPGGDIAL